MRSRRSSDPNSANNQLYGGLPLCLPLLHAAGKACAEEAQRKIDERHAKAAETSKPSKNLKYSYELKAEIFAMHDAGWPPREIARVVDLPVKTVSYIITNCNRIK